MIRYDLYVFLRADWPIKRRPQQFHLAPAGLTVLTKLAPSWNEVLTLRWVQQRVLISSNMLIGPQPAPSSTERPNLATTIAKLS